MPSRITKTVLMSVTFGCSSVGIVSGQPVHDECLDAIEIESDVPWSDTTEGATGVDLTTCGRTDTADVWHTWRPDCSGPATISLCGSAFDTVLAVYDACDGEQLACVNDSPQHCTQEDRSVLVNFPVVRRTLYWIRVSGATGQTGEYTLMATCLEAGYGACCLPGGACVATSADDCAARGGEFIPDESCNGLDCSSQRPPNDLCADATEVFTGQPVAASNVNATGRGLTACGDDQRDIWFRWRSECALFADVSLCGSDFDTVLTVYDGCGGAELACNDDDPQCQRETSSRLRRIRVQRDDEYVFRVAGYKGDTGQIVLNVRCAREPQSGRRGSTHDPESARRWP